MLNTHSHIHIMEKSIGFSSDRNHKMLANLTANHIAETDSTFNRRSIYECDIDSSFWFISILSQAGLQNKMDVWPKRNLHLGVKKDKQK